MEIQGKRILEDHSDQEKFSVSVSPLNVELPNILFNNKNMESDSYKQLQKLVQAGLHQEKKTMNENLIMNLIDNQVTTYPMIFLKEYSFEST